MSKTITWTPKTQKLAVLKDWDKNPRSITGEALARLKQRITDRGFHDVVKVDTDNVILSGTQRRKALEELGVAEVWTMVPSRKLTEAERKAVVLESNRNEGEDDWIKLKEYFSASELMAGGFGKDEIAKFFDNMVEVEEDDFDAEAEAAKLKLVVPKTGDIWQLGDHRLACGDSTDPALYPELMDGVKADMCWTDPPYNVNYDYKNKYDGIGKARKGRFVGGSKVFNDNLTPEQFGIFLTTVFKNVYDHTVDSSGMYCCHATKSQEQFFEALKVNGWHFSQTIIWLKERIILALGQDYHRIYEPIWYGWKKGKKRWSNKGQSTEKEVWDVDRMTFEERLDVWYLHRDKSKDYQHPTQKPVRLPERAIKKSCPLGGVVLEPFCGSGSALIACEQLHRKCYAIELDPRYCQVIIARWQRYTKRTAECLTRPEAVIIEP
mgnify:FL=1